MSLEKLPQRLAKIKQGLYVTNEYGAEYQKSGAVIAPADLTWLQKEYEIRADWHPMCQACQVRQLIKYYDTNHIGFERNRFSVRCTGVPAKIDISKRQLDDIVAQNDIDSERAMLFLKSTQDTVAWASLMFGFDDNNPDWRLRPYQKEQLRCTSKRLVIREGRRAGKTFLAALKLICSAFTVEIDKGLSSTGSKIVKGPQIMIVTPYQSQITNIFNEMEALIKRNVELVSMVTTGTAGNLYVKTPFCKMEFSNGAVIAGFVSGVGTKVDGSGGGTMRGQSADIIYLDEMDMIPDEVLENVITPILLSTPNVQLIATSTPIGKRGKFWRYCLERPDFKEDYLPSTVLPQWEEIKHEVEAESTKEGFRAEYMAEFVDGSDGVFKPSYVFNARRDYTYEDCERLNWWHTVPQVSETTELIKVIGIDWNKNAGTEFVVIAYHPGKHHWYVVESTNIPASDFSSVAWKEEVVRLNYKHKPQYIYADEGYGHTIIEDLKLLSFSLKGKAHADRRDVETARIAERLVAFNFSQRVELRSPIDGTVILKTGKEYLVENAIRVFEDGRIWFPESDHVLKDQLLNYRVLRRTITNNKPVYGPENEIIGDHRLDGLMLALGGLSIEYSPYSKNAGPKSELNFIPKQELDRRTESRQGISALQALSNIAGPADRFGRRNFAMEEDSFMKAVNATKTDSRGRRSSKERSIIGKESNQSVFEQMAKRATNWEEVGRDPNPGEKRASAHVVERRGSKQRGFAKGSRRR